MAGNYKLFILAIFSEVVSFSDFCLTVAGVVVLHVVTVTLGCFNYKDVAQLTVCSFPFFSVIHKFIPPTQDTVAASVVMVHVRL